MFKPVDSNVLFFLREDGLEFTEEDIALGATPEHEVYHQPGATYLRTVAVKELNPQIAIRAWQMAGNEVSQSNASMFSGDYAMFKLTARKPFKETKYNLIFEAVCGQQLATITMQIDDESGEIFPGQLYKGVIPDLVGAYKMIENTIGDDKDDLDILGV